MAIARSQQINLATTPYYHCISRCVRRAFLCGKDPLTGNSYEHRRAWVEERLLTLAGIFSIDICAYAVMNNHIHVVLYINEQAKNWTIKEVLKRWHKLHQGTQFTRQYVEGKQLPDFAIALVHSSAEVYRQRLMSISWFMKELNEPIARSANQEDHCTGRFWEGRFKSQALLDEAALIACMAYVDLNPIRAGIATTPENSDHTSVKKRLDNITKKGNQSDALKPFLIKKQDMLEIPPLSTQNLPFDLLDYLELVDLTGRSIRKDKIGTIDMSLMPILQRINLSSKQWLVVSNEFGQHFKTAVGKEESLIKHCRVMNKQRCSNISSCRKYLSN